MHDYNSVWEKVSSRFWKHRRREYVIHLILFLSINLPLWLLDTNLPDGSFLRFNVGQYIIGGIYINWVYIPWITVWSGLLLLVHSTAFLSARIVERIFRLRVERELLRAYVDEDAAEKPKRQPLQPDDDEVFEYAEESRDEQRKFSR